MFNWLRKEWVKTPPNMGMMHYEGRRIRVIRKDLVLLEVRYWGWLNAPDIARHILQMGDKQENDSWVEVWK